MQSIFYFTPLFSHEANLHGKYDFDTDVNTAPFDMNAVKSLNIKLM